MRFQLFQLICGLLLVAIMGRIVAGNPAFGFLTQRKLPRWEVDNIETNVEQDQIITEQLIKDPENNPNFLSNWPYLTELLPKLDYDDNTSSIQMPTPIPLRNNSPPNRNGNVKENLQKKNTNTNHRKEYMSPCHFKICNMGRKRNVLPYFKK